MSKVCTVSFLSCCICATLLPTKSLANQDEISSNKLSLQDEVFASGYYWVSEKLDGIRALWTGKELLTRKGNKISAPEWFTRELPNFSIEGELWAGRGRFNFVQKTVLDIEPQLHDWSEIQFMLFGLPNDYREYKQQYLQLLKLVDRLQSQHIRVIKQRAVSSHSELVELLDQTEQLGGEGLMLRKVDTDQIRVTKPVKIKRHMDSEGTIIAYKNGNGKYDGLVGALVLKLDNGKILSVGSGLSDKIRANPPALGERVTFRYNGYTSNDLPRFARFLRVRKPE
ncbi:DNA ligase [Vibrio sp. DW001]|uniref:DNA ligase n=1 Tax=Vibrio sp. DW001 TaxID=2912315 RepID=UPI0023B19F6C|nr:DNA ligase [Vibrio sp. DW001]WED28201.1 DNA ligase [Vibrio sp. DW001]